MFIIGKYLLRSNLNELFIQILYLFSVFDLFSETIFIID